MNILTIAYYTIKREFRDKKSISLTLVFPIMLILILGTALGKAFTPDTLSKINVTYLSEQKTEISQQFDSFLKDKNIKELLEVKTVNNYDEGVKLVNDKKTSAFIYIPANISVNTEGSKKDIIRVYQSKDNALNATIVKNLVDSFVNGANTIEAQLKMGTMMPNYSVHNNIVEKPITTKGTIPRAIDYYAVTMLALTLMYGALYGSYGMAEDKNSRTEIRIKSAPIKPYINYIGKTLGLIVTLMLQAIILILFTKYVYHSNWGSDLTTVFLLSGLFSIFATGLGIMAYAVTNNTAKAAALINILVVVLTFIAGGYAKINADGTLFDKLSYVSPNKLFQTAVFNTIYGGSHSLTTNCIIALIAASALMFIIASVLGRRELI